MIQGKDRRQGGYRPGAAIPRIYRRYFLARFMGESYNCIQIEKETGRNKSPR